MNEGYGQVKRKGPGGGQASVTLVLQGRTHSAGWAGDHPRLGYFQHFQMILGVNRRSVKRTKQRQKPCGWYEKNVPEATRVGKNAAQHSGTPDSPGQGRFGSWGPRRGEQLNGRSRGRSGQT